MKNKKLFFRILCFVLCLVLVTLVACTGNGGDGEPDGDTPNGEPPDDNTGNGDNSGSGDSTGNEDNTGDNTGNGDNTGDDDPTDKGPAAKDWVNVTTYNKRDALDAYLSPIWYTREVYDETMVIVGNDGEATLLYEPNGQKLVVRNYELNKTYVEGVDYVIEGKTLKRLKTGSLPYFKVDDYFMESVPTTPGYYKIYLNPDECEFDFEEDRYIVFGEQSTLTKGHYITVSYTTDEAWSGAVPTDQSEKMTRFLNKVKGGDATIMFYGDSITVGANASGSVHGGLINPFLPTYPELIKHYLDKKFDVDVTVINESQGAWKAANGLENFSSLVKPVARSVDLLVLAFGMNDTTTDPVLYKGQIQQMANAYLSENPDGTVLLVSPMLPNRQSTLVKQQPKFEAKLGEIAEVDGAVAVAEVTSMFTSFEATGKRSRDWLANNCKHPNDFGVRVYAQVILATILGQDFWTGA